MLKKGKAWLSTVILMKAIILTVPNHQTESPDNITIYGYQQIILDLAYRGQWRRYYQVLEAFQNSAPVDTNS